MKMDDDFDFIGEAGPAAQSASVTQYLVVSISGLQIGVPLERVSEVLSYQPFSSIPGAPEQVLGLIHVRERVVPVFDLARRLGRAPCALSKRSCVLMLELKLAGEPLPVGVIVDGVATLLDVERGEINPPPRLGLNLKPKHIHGVVATAKGLLPLIEIETLFVGDDLQAAEEISSLDPSALPNSVV